MARTMWTSWWPVVAPLLLLGVVVSAQQHSLDLDLPVVRPEHRTPDGLRPIPAPTRAPVEGLSTGPVEEKDPRDEPPPVIYGEEIDEDANSIVYVIDVSCSMTESSRPVEQGLGPNGAPVFRQPDGSYTSENTVPTKLERLKEELTKSISGLPSHFTFNIVSFTCSTSCWSMTMQKAEPGAKASAIAWARALQADGATGTGPATALGLSLDRQNTSVVLITDGAPNCSMSAVEHRRMISSNNTQHASITVFGVSTYGETRAWCQAVASENSGAFFDVN